LAAAEDFSTEALVVLRFSAMTFSALPTAVLARVLKIWNCASSCDFVAAENCSVIEDMVSPEIMMQRNKSILATILWLGKLFFLPWHGMHAAD
jgi:hypothetical protein